MTLRDAWQKAAPMAIPLVAGACIGWAAHGTKVETRVEYKDRVVTQEHVVTVEKPVIEYRDRVTTKTVYRDGPVKEVVRREDKTSKETGSKETTTDASTVKDVERTTVAAPEGRWAVRGLAGVDTRGGIVAGAAADYRVFGPLTVGVWGVGPVGGSGQSPWTLGVSAGARF